MSVPKNPKDSRGLRLDMREFARKSKRNSPNAMKKLRDYDEKGTLPEAVRRRLNQTRK
jgi:hypothetical protein